MATYNMKAKTAACVHTISFCDRGTPFHLIDTNLGGE